MGFLSFLNPKWIIALIIVALIGFGWYKWEHAQTQIEEAQLALLAEKKNVETLRANEIVIRQVNEGNQKVIDQLQIEKQDAAKAISDLKANVTVTNRQLDATKRKLATITTPAVPLTPYLVEAVEAIQAIRGVQAPAPAAPASAPAAPASAPKQIKKVNL